MNRPEARDFIFDYSRDAWNEAVAALSVPNTTIRFQGRDESAPNNGVTWARVSMQTVNEYQETLRNGEGRRFVTEGLVFVQIFLPRTSKAQALADKLAEYIRNIFRDRGVADHLEFTGAAIDDNVRPEPAWYPVNVTARFAYRQFI